MRRTGRTRVVVVRLEVPADDVVDESVAVVVDAVDYLVDVLPDVVFEIRVTVIGAGVDVGDHHALAPVAPLPELVGVEQADVRLDGPGHVRRRVLGRQVIGGLAGLVGADQMQVAHPGVAGQTLDGRRVELGDQQVGDPEALDVANRTARAERVEFGQEAGLRRGGEVLEEADDVGAALAPVEKSDLGQYARSVELLVEQHEDVEQLTRCGGLHPGGEAGIDVGG